VAVILFVKGTDEIGMFVPVSDEILQEEDLTCPNKSGIQI
jgi:hypothetical protein